MRPALALYAALALSVALVGTLWVIPYLPTNDGPEAILAVHIENHYGDPGTIYRDVFVPAAEFAGRGFTVLYEPLEDLLGWQRGLSVALSIIVLTEAWGFVALVHAVDPRRLPLAVLGFPLALSWTLYMGFFPFVFAGGVGLFIVALALRRPSTAVRVGLSALLLLQCFLHMFAAILTGLVVACALVVRAPRGGRLRETGASALIGLPAAALATAAFFVARASAVKLPFAGTFDFAPLRATLLTWPQTLWPGPLSRALIATSLLLAVTVFACVRAPRRDTSPIDKAFCVVAVLFLLTSLLSPRSVPGWQMFSQRFIWLGVVLVVVVLPFERLGRRAAAVCAGLCFVCAATSLGLTYEFHRRLAAEYDDAVAGLFAPVTRHSVILPMNLEPYGPPPRDGRPRVVPGEPEVPLLVPLSHIGALYAAAQGGVMPYSFATNSATWPFTIRPDAPSPGPVPAVEGYAALLSSAQFRTDGAFRAKVTDELAMFGIYYEGIVLTGARPEDLALFRSRGFVADWERGSVMVAHFEPCRIDVVLPPDVAPPLLDLGVDVPRLRPMLEDAKLPVEHDPDGSAQLVVRGGPCGRVWARPHWDSPAGGHGVGKTFCSNAPAKGKGAGKLEAVVTRTEGRITCTGVRAPGADEPAAGVP